MREEISVFLLSGNRLLREALERVLSKRRDIRVVGAVPWGPQVREMLAAAEAEILLTDILATDTADVTQLRDLLSTATEAKAILIGMREDERLFLEAVRAGVRGYVLDEASALEVVEAVRRVAAGEAVCPPRLTTTLFDFASRQAAVVPNAHLRVRLGLTRREQQLVPMIAGGLTNKEIAAELNLSEQTVKNHIHRMLRKAGVSDRLSIVELCRSEGFSC